MRFQVFNRLSVARIELVKDEESTASGKKPGANRGSHMKSSPSRILFSSFLLNILLLIRPADADPGRLDNSFNSGSGIDGDVSSLVLQPDGKVLIGGFFSTVQGTSRNSIARLDAEGRLD